MDYALGLALGMIISNVVRRQMAVIFPTKNEDGVEAFAKLFEISSVQLKLEILQHNEEDWNDDEEDLPIDSYAFGRIDDFKMTIEPGKWPSILSVTAILSNLPSLCLPHPPYFVACI